MKLITLGVAAALAVGSIGLACAAPNMITNGNFNSTNSNLKYSGPTEIPGSGTVDNGTSSDCTYGGQFVSGWTASGYSIWYGSAGAATGTNACTRFGVGASGENGNTEPGVGQRLPPGNGDAGSEAGTVTAPPVGPGSFVGLDGESDSYQGSIAQKVSVTAGQSYTVSFYWAGTQEMSTWYKNIDNPTCQWLTVSLGSDSQSTPNSNPGCTQPSEDDAPSDGIPVDALGFTGWMSQSFTFTAGNTGDEWLTFMANGNPSVPPFALVTGVTMTQNVPEPPELAMFGLGLLGLGLLTVFARRRALRRNGEGDLG